MYEWGTEYWCMKNNQQKYRTIKEQNNRCIRTSYIFFILAKFCENCLRSLLSFSFVLQTMYNNPWYTVMTIVFTADMTVIILETVSDYKGEVDSCICASDCKTVIATGNIVVQVWKIIDNNIIVTKTFSVKQFSRRI